MTFAHTCIVSRPHHKYHFRLLTPSSVSLCLPVPSVGDYQMLQLLCCCCVWCAVCRVLLCGVFLNM